MKSIYYILQEMKIGNAITKKLPDITKHTHQGMGIQG
jgi:hypothetical protein